MALQTPFFSKRDAEPLNPRSSGASSPYSNASTHGAHSSAAALPIVGNAPAAAPLTTATGGGGGGGGSKLTVGPNIKLKGVEITDCDTLFVEGLVEATMDSRLMQISEQGAFKGSADIDIAEIHGKFDGDLTVRQKLMIYATGKVTGRIRYGKLVIEEGGQLSGEVQFGATAQQKPVVAKPALQAIA